MAEWEFFTGINDSGIYPSMRIYADQKNNTDTIHLSYYDTEEELLKYAKIRNNSVEGIWAIDQSYKVGKFNSLGIDSEGHIHIAYYDENNGVLKYILWNFSKTTIDGNEGNDVGLFTSIAIDSLNHPQISYYDKTNGDLKYIFNNSIEWQAIAVDEDGDVGKYSSLALDSNNFPHISYYDETTGALKYATFDGTEWKIEVIDPRGGVGEHTSLAIDSTDKTHIAYYDYRFKKLKYALFDGERWRTQFVLSQFTDLFTAFGSYCSLKLDSKDQPHISYYNETLGQVQYTEFDGLRWRTETPYNITFSGPYNCLALDAMDNPYIAIFTSIEKLDFSE